MKLVDVLKPDYIQIPLKGKSKEEVIKELIQILASAQYFSDHDSVSQMKKSGQSSVMEIGRAHV